MRTAILGAAVVLLLAAVLSTKSADDRAAKALKPTLELELAPESLEGLDDKAGTWQFEGGKVIQDAKHAANFASVLRVVTKGTTEQNTAIVTTTIFFLGDKPPQNITLQGAHDYNSGEEIGSVSAASSAYAAYIGKPFLLVDKKLTIGAGATAPRGL